jgi:hypothetical protein
MLNAVAGPTNISGTRTALRMAVAWRTTLLSLMKSTLKMNN